MKARIVPDNSETQEEYPIVKAIREQLDPLAVVCGGRALNLAYGIPSTDVDIYITSLYTFKSAFKKKIKEFMRSNFSGLPVDYTCDTEYGHGNELMATITLESGLKVQLIWAKLSQIPGEYGERVQAILSQFDLSICQIAIDYQYLDLGRNSQRRHRGFVFNTIHTPGFEVSRRNKRVDINPNMNAYQREKTFNERVPKYKERFPNFKFYFEGNRI